MNPQNLITPTGRRIAAALGAGALLLTASACGSSGSSNDPANANAGTEGGQGPQTSQQGAGFPGADGLVAAVTGSTAQVQSQGSGQVAVTWSGSTTFTKQVSAELADVKVGSCVSVQPTEDATSGTDGSTDSTTAPTAVTAASVRITAKGSDGTCTGGFGGAGGAGRPQFNGNGGGSGGQPPAGGPEGGQAPSGGQSGGPQLRGVRGTFGEVTAVSGTGFTVKATVPQFNGASGSSTPTTTESTVTVTVSGTTAYSTTGKGAASDVKVGVCVRAQGKADDTGAIAATSVAVTPATNGECNAGFRRGGTGGPGTSQGTTNQES